MSKVAVVYWSGTGNTECMAQAVFMGILGNGAEAELFNCADFNASMLGDFDAVAFGCPAMGSEELEDSFEEMFSACESELSGKKIALFGSFSWADGEWMETWTDRCVRDGAALACDSVTCRDYPDAEAIDKCTELGKALA